MLFLLITDAYKLNPYIFQNVCQKGVLCHISYFHALIDVYVHYVCSLKLFVNDYFQINLITSTFVYVHIAMYSYILVLAICKRILASCAILITHSYICVHIYTLFHTYVHTYVHASLVTVM